ncbi:sensor histidine kinase [Kitasatospora sp. McL0602]|uniref:sensor histidine kinase n=1 Tax=Kitasatospora sp. McL0602 TaxID=3439530 RepID=UPI003F8C0C58
MTAASPAAPQVRFVSFLWRPHSRWHQRAIDLLLVLTAGLDAALNYPPPRDWSFWASLAAAGVLLLRRRLPLTVLLAALPGLFAGRALIAAMVAVYTVARTARPVWQRVLATALVVVGLFIPWPVSEFVHMTASELCQQLIYAVMLGTGPAWLGLLAQTRKDLSDRVAELATVRDQERALHAETVLAKERARIAREMHDVVSHQAGLIAVQAGALEVTARDPDVRKVAGTVRGLAVATLEELRSMILVLRAAGAGPTELAPQPRLADLPKLVAASEVDVSLRIDLAGRAVPEPVERAAYRTVQEALTNVRKHAPGAITSVTVAAEEDTLEVAVRNGVPTVEAPPVALPGGRHGIVGLRERAALLDGTLTALPRHDGGFDVLLRVPLPRSSEENLRQP